MFQDLSSWLAKWGFHIYELPNIGLKNIKNLNIAISAPSVLYYLLFL